MMRQNSVPPQEATGSGTTGQQRRHRGKPNRGSAQHQQQPPQRPSRRLLKSRWERERRLRRLFIAIGVMVVLAIVGVLLAGYYSTSVVSPGRTVATVNGAIITSGELAETLQLWKATTGISREPHTVLNEMIDTELINQNKIALGISISTTEVDELLRSQFTPVSLENPETEAVTQDDQEFLRLFNMFLENTGISEERYRKFLRSRALHTEAFESFRDQAPKELEQVFLHGIRVIDPSDAETVQGMLDDGIEFGHVAKDFNHTQAITSTPNEPVFLSEDGSIGWIPRGVYPDLDDILFELDVDEVRRIDLPTSGTNTKRFHFVKISEGPLAREVEESMRNDLGLEAVRVWIEQQRTDALVERDLDDGEYKWVLKQLI